MKSELIGNHPESDQIMKIHTRVLELALTTTQACSELMVRLRCLADNGWHVDLGCASISEYADRACGFSARKTRELLRTSRQLDELPLTAAAFRDGTIVWSKVREISRVATPETEEAWLEFARDRTSSQVARGVSGSQRGQNPPSSDEPPQPPTTCRVTFELQPTTAERLMRAVALVRASMATDSSTAEEVDDDAVLDSIARMVSDQLTRECNMPSAEAFRVVVTECPTCETMTHVGRSGDRVVASEVRDAIKCDSEIVGSRGGRRRTISTRKRRRVLATQKHRCAVPGCTNTLWLDVHHIVRVADGGTSSEGNLVGLCTGHHRCVHAGGLRVFRDPAGALQFERRRPFSMRGEWAEAAEEVRPAPPNKTRDPDEDEADMS